MARVSTKDPLDKFRWAVEIDGFTRMGFASCETPSVSINTQAYPEGGAHLFPKRIVDSVEYKPVTFQRGVTSDINFHKWAIQYAEFLRGFRLVNNGTQKQEAVDYRRDVRIHHLDRAGRIVKTYVLYNAFPVEYKPASDFSADSDDTLSMEKLVLIYESFDVLTPAAPESNPLDPTDILKRLIRRM